MAMSKAVGIESGAVIFLTVARMTRKSLQAVACWGSTGTVDINS